MRLDAAESWARLAASDSAVLATINADGTPHMVPFVFAPADPDYIVFAVDAKPKGSRRLRRLDNIAQDSRVTVLADHYEPDWTRLWWVRAEGTAAVTDAEPDPGGPLLRERHPHYRDQELGPWVVITVERITGWSASG